MPCRGGLQNCTPAMFLSTVDAPIAVRWSSVACLGSVLNTPPAMAGRGAPVVATWLPSSVPMLCTAISVRHECNLVGFEFGASRC
jgi:hypothetical protein